MGSWQKWLSNWARWWNIIDQSQPNPTIRGDGLPCTRSKARYFHSDITQPFANPLSECTLRDAAACDMHFIALVRAMPCIFARAAVTFTSQRRKVHGLAGDLK